MDSPEETEPEVDEMLERSRRRGRSIVSAMLGVAASMGATMPGMNRHSSQYDRYDPERPKTQDDLEKLEAARKKRERKAKRKGNNGHQGG